jgi:hypothetical protein
LPTVCARLTAQAGSFRIQGAASALHEPWWPADDDDADAVERAARHPHWDDKPRERLMLDEASRLRR